MSESSTSTASGSSASNGQNQSVANSEMKPSEDFLDYLKAYARAEPEKAALWCAGVGFILGWKLKPW